jgi:hypothetical protein
VREAKNLGSILHPSLTEVHQRCFASLKMTAPFLRSLLVIQTAAERALLIATLASVVIVRAQFCNAPDGSAAKPRQARN